MKKCYICLEQDPLRRYLTTGPVLWNTKCCGVLVHYHCQVAWGNECIICNNQLKVVSTERFHYVPDFPELTEAEIEENRRVEEFYNQRHENIYIPLFNQVVARLRMIPPDYDSDENMSDVSN